MNESKTHDALMLCAWLETKCLPGLGGVRPAMVLPMEGGLCNRRSRTMAQTTPRSSGGSYETSKYTTKLCYFCCFKKMMVGTLLWNCMVMSNHCAVRFNASVSTTLGPSCRGGFHAWCCLWICHDLMRRCTPLTQWFHSATALGWWILCVH